MRFNNNHIFQMNRSELIRVLSDAFSKMLCYERDLFDAVNQVQERAFMHRFAFWLQYILKDKSFDGDEWRLFVDVEYNRDGDDVKRIDNGKVWTAPDIIFHERKSGAIEGRYKYGNDVFCCEMKKHGRPRGEDAERVKMFMAEKRYLFGIDFYQFACRDAKFDLYEKKRSARVINFVKLEIRLSLLKQRTRKGRYAKQEDCSNCNNGIVAGCVDGDGLGVGTFEGASCPR